MKTPELLSEVKDNHIIDFKPNSRMIQHSMIEDNRETFSIEHRMEKATKHYHLLALLHHFKPISFNEVVDLRTQKRGIDFILYNEIPKIFVRNAIRKTYGDDIIKSVAKSSDICVECKTDTHYTTGNLFFEEKVINRQNERKGWIVYSQADVVSYLIGEKIGKQFFPRVIYFIDLHDLKEWYFFNKKNYPLIEVYDKSLYQRVKGRIIPIWSVRKCVIESYNLEMTE
jgi:hypothetical protein